MTALDHHDDSYTDQHGHIHAACTCGWTLTGFAPDQTLATDALMEHAYAAGYTAGRSALLLDL